MLRCQQHSSLTGRALAQTWGNVLLELNKTHQPIFTQSESRAPGTIRQQGCERLDCDGPIRLCYRNDPFTGSTFTFLCYGRLEPLGKSAELEGPWIASGSNSGISFANPCQAHEGAPLIDVRSPLVSCILELKAGDNLGCSTPPAEFR